MWNFKTIIHNVVWYVIHNVPPDKSYTICGSTDRRAQHIRQRPVIILGLVHRSTFLLPRRNIVDSKANSCTVCSMYYLRQSVALLAISTVHWFNRTTVYASHPSTRHTQAETYMFLHIVERSARARGILSVPTPITRLVFIILYRLFIFNAHR